MIVHLIRHGECASGPDPVLTDVGRTQAREVAGRVRGAVRLHSSDLRRAAQTASLIGAELDLAVVVDPRLRELGQGSGSERLRQIADDLRGGALSDGGETILVSHGDAIPHLAVLLGRPGIGALAHCAVVTVEV